RRLGHGCAQSVCLFVSAFKKASKIKSVITLYDQHIIATIVTRISIKEWGPFLARFTKLEIKRGCQHKETHYKLSNKIKI
ncbi:hypothetical protein, partial [Pseudomonas syringae group genomosp. 7]